jgi:hypothetical protein
VKIKLRTDVGQLTIYREKYGVLMYGLLLAAACIAFGAVFQNLIQANLFAALIGWVFIGAGILLLAGLPKYYIRMRQHGGAVLLVADQAGLVLAPELNMTPFRYAWDDIAQLILTRKLVSKARGGHHYSWNLVMVLFKPGRPLGNFGLLERSRRKLSSTAEGKLFVVVGFPKRELARLAAEFKRIAPAAVAVHTADRTVLD